MDGEPAGMPGSPESMSLGRVQLLLLSGLAEAPRLPPHEQEALFRRPPEGSVSGRWDVYTSGYLARLVEALENDYPAVRRILGSKMKKPDSRSLLIASLAGLLSVPAVMAARGAGEAAEGEVVHCYGVNKCKGIGDCGGPGHSCANQNECKRKGYLDMDKELCLKLDGGRLTPEPEK